MKFLNVKTSILKNTSEFVSINDQYFYKFVFVLRPKLSIEGSKRPYVNKY